MSDTSTLQLDPGTIDGGMNGSMDSGLNGGNAGGGGDFAPPQLRRASFNNNIRQPLRQRGQQYLQQGRQFLTQQGNRFNQTAHALQRKAPGFFLKYRQLMIITVLGTILYVLCIAKVKNHPNIPIVVGVATTALMLYFIKRYADQVMYDKIAVAGWVLVAGLVAGIISMSIWIEQNK